MATMLLAASLVLGRAWPDHSCSRPVRLTRPTHCSRAPIGAVFCALPEGDESFDELFAEGTACVESGELDLALVAFRAAAKLDPEHEPTQQLIEKLSLLSVDADADDDDAELEAELAALDDEDAAPPCPPLSSVTSSLSDSEQQRTDAAVFRDTVMGYYRNLSGLA